MVLKPIERLAKSHKNKLKFLGRITSKGAYTEKDRSDRHANLNKLKKHISKQISFIQNLQKGNRNPSLKLYLTTLNNQLDAIVNNNENQIAFLSASIKNDEKRILTALVNENIKDPFEKPAKQMIGTTMMAGMLGFLGFRNEMNNKINKHNYEKEPTPIVKRVQSDFKQIYSQRTPPKSQIIVNKEQMKEVFFRASNTDIEKNFEPLNAAMIKYGITDKLEIAHFLSQVAHESGHLKYTEEIHDGSNYEFRRDLGNDQKGDGVKYKGRGLIMLTGKYNYIQYSRHVGFDFTKNPEMLSKPEFAADVAAYFWTTRGIGKLARKNSFKEVTKKITGSRLQGIHDRKVNLKHAMKAFDLS